MGLAAKSDRPHAAWRNLWLLVLGRWLCRPHRRVDLRPALDGPGARAGTGRGIAPISASRGDKTDAHDSLAPAGTPPMAAG